MSPGIVAPIAVLLAAASTSPAKPAPRDRAKQVLQSRGCDKCHDSAVSAENARALAVYDLVEEDWPARMPDSRLPRLLTRLKSAPAADQRVVRHFIAAELKRRAAAGR